jgi:hypothetical protein
MISLQTTAAIETTLPDLPDKAVLLNAEKNQSMVVSFGSEEALFSSDLPIRMFSRRMPPKATQPESTIEELQSDSAPQRRDPSVFQPRLDETSWKAIVAQRQALVKKKFGPGLNDQEARRLSLLEWQLDRIDMVSYNSTLTRLEEMVARQEAVAQNLNVEIRRLQKR